MREPEKRMYSSPVLVKAGGGWEMTLGYIGDPRDQGSAGSIRQMRG